MLPTIATGNVGSALAGEYEVANSLRFNDDSSDTLSRTPSSSGNRKTFTLSFWYKRGNIVANTLISSSLDGNNFGGIDIDNNSRKFQFFTFQGGSTTINLITTRVFRDVSAWYHILIAVDTTQGTDTNRVKLYINGVQETAFDTSVYPSQNLDTIFNVSSYAHRIGVNNDNNGRYLDGYLAEVVNVDGLQLDATSFGEFDEDTGIWKPIDVSGLTFGTNGFYLDFENSGSLGADVSGNGNNFTVNNLTSIDQTTDTPTNNYATLNPLAPWSNTSYSEGNCIASGSAGAWQIATGTIGVSQGKWYWEVLFSGGTAGNYHAGVTDESANNYNGTHSQNGTTTFYNGDGGEVYKGGIDVFTTANYGTMNASSDILGVALNMDDKEISFYKNGSAIVSNFSLHTPCNLVFPITAQYGSSQVSKYNFGGSPSFAISSGNSDGNGYGNFEYSVPSGYYSLNTKNLSEFG